MINKKDKQEILVSLLLDIFVVFVLLFGITFLAEALIPGIVTSKIGWRYMILFLFADLGLIYYLSVKFNLSLAQNFWLNKKRIPFWGIFVILILVGSFWRGSLVSLIIAGLSALLVWGFLKVFQEK